MFCERHTNSHCVTVCRRPVAELFISRCQYCVRAAVYAVLWCCCGSLQLQLRTLIHMELAKCEQDIDHLSLAVEHVKKVL